MSPTLLFVLMALCAFRVTRLITKDEFPPVAVARERVAGRYGDDSWQAYLARCPWCVGVYVSAGVTLATWLAVGLPVPLLWWGAVAAVVGLAAKLDGALDRD